MLGVDGLSEEEAALKVSDERLEESKQVSRKRLKHTLRRTTFSVFNLTMLVLALTLLWLGDPLGALSTLGVLLLNIAVNSFQQIFASLMVEKAAVQARAFATVIRSGKIISVDLNQVVVGDVLVAGKGDEILANGILLAAHEFELVDPANPETLISVDIGGDIASGTVCMRGEAVYRIDEIPPVQSFDTNSEDSDQEKTQIRQKLTGTILKPEKRKQRRLKKRTPLEKILQRILFFLLAICAVFYLILVLQVMRIDILTPEIELLYRDVMSILFSLSPAGFFLIVIVNYAMGTIDLARQGALVRDNRSIELIAQLNSLITIRSQGLTDIRAELEMIPAESGEPVLAENFVRRILGELSRSVPTQHEMARILEDSFAGERIKLADSAFFPTIYHWVAVSITSPERRGTYVIGTAEALKPYLNLHRKRHIRHKKDEAQDKTGTKRGGKVRGFLSRFHGIRKEKQNNSSDTEKGEEQTLKPALYEESEADKPTDSVSKVSPVKISHQQNGASKVTSNHITGNSNNPDNNAKPELTEMETGELREENPGQKGLVGFIKKTAGRLTNMIERIQDLPEPLKSGDEDLATLLLAYRPEPYRLYLPDQRPAIPGNLLPICHIHFTRSLEPGLIEMIERFTAGGVRTRFFTDWFSDEMIEVVQKSGLVKPTDQNKALLTSANLSRLIDQQTNPNNKNQDKPDDPVSIISPSSAIQSAVFYQRFTPIQKKLVVHTLRRDREYVGVIGSSISDWQVMNDANLSIAPKSSDQAIITNTNVVLTKDNPPPLNPVLERSQQIVHSTLDVIKLNMVPIFYILFLFGIMLLWGNHTFIYNATQGGMIAFFTVVIPSIAVSFWARKGAIHVETMAKELIFFIFPPAIVITLMEVIFSLFFQSQSSSFVEVQNVNTHYLIATGLLVAVFIKPPTSWLAGGAKVARSRGKGDFRLSFTAAAIWILFNLVIFIPLLQNLMKIKPLELCDNIWDCDSSCINEWGNDAIFVAFCTDILERKTLTSIPGSLTIGTVTKSNCFTKYDVLTIYAELKLTYLSNFATMK